MVSLSVTELSREDERLPNHNPGFLRTYLAWVALAWALEALLILASALALPHLGALPASRALEILILTLGLGALAVWMTVGGYAAYRAATPDWIAIGSDSVVVFFGRHPAGRSEGRTAKIPFSMIRDVPDSRGLNFLGPVLWFEDPSTVFGVYAPAGIQLHYPASGSPQHPPSRGRLRPPAFLRWNANAINLTDENARLVRDALEEARGAAY